MWKRLATSLFLVFAASTALASGSLDFKDVQSVLEQQPELARLLRKQFEIAETGMASRLGGHFEKLVGRRVGPYRFRAKPAGQPGPYTLEITICTTFRVILAEGKEAEPATSASDVEEKLQYVIIREILPENKLGLC